VNVLPFLLVLTVAGAWILLPVWPALRELWRPSDAEPLDAVGQDAGDLTVFADGFRDYMTRALPATAPGEAPVPTGALADGTPFVQLADDAAPLSAARRADGAVPCVVITTTPFALPGGTTFLLECHARDALRGGEGNIYRALLGEGDVTLGAGSVVLRWVHAVGDLRLGPECVVYGRASSGRHLMLAPGVSFRRVRAERVAAWRFDENGDALDTSLAARLGEPPQLPPVVSATAKLPATARRERGFTRVAGDLTVPPGGALVGALVVEGRLTVGDGARIGGHVKVHGECILGDDAIIDGAVVSRQSIVMGARAHARGPLVAERDVTLGEHASVGSPRTPSSVAGDVVLLHHGAQVFGAVTARLEGRVSP
jgi:cytoskeletal protein CcmA (bactofilin family)